MIPMTEHIAARLSRLDVSEPVYAGKVLRYDGTVLECAGFPAARGTRCRIMSGGRHEAEGEIAGFSKGHNLVLLDRNDAAVTTEAWVQTIPGGLEIAVGPSLLGRVTDADGAPLDERPTPDATDRWPLRGRPLNPLARTPVDTPLDTGIRSINAALSVGRGQRVGIVAGSGVGKSVLIEMMIRNTDADIVVLGLVGERAREVGAFVAQLRSMDALERCAVVAVPADRSPTMRLRGAMRATAIAEYFRAQGRHVLLILDSLTRVAHARREIGLALGEQPTARGYPPSALSMIPTLIERAGTGLPGEGTITAFYTVLADGDDTTADPVVDSARAILDGHVVLSRAIAQKGLYPAIDLPASISRVMNDIVDPAHARAGRELRRMVALYTENRDMMLMGAYTPGMDAELDRAIALWPQIEAFLSQDHHEASPFAVSRDGLLALTGAAT